MVKKKLFAFKSSHFEQKLPLRNEQSTEVSTNKSEGEWREVQRHFFKCHTSIVASSSLILESLVIIVSAPVSQHETKLNIHVKSIFIFFDFNIFVL